MTQTKQNSSSDNFLLAVDFRLEGRNLRGLALRLLGVITALTALAAKAWVLMQGKTP